MKESVFMSKSDKNELSFFGIKINNNALTILFFFSLTGIISRIGELYVMRSFIHLFDGYTFAELIEVFDSVLFNWVRFLIPLMMTIIYLYVILNFLLVQKSYRETEDFKIRWFGFGLTKTSVPILFILSILNLIITVSTMYYSIASLVSYLQSGYSYPEYIINSYIISIVSSIVLTIIYIYTLIICLQNRRSNR